MDWKKFANRAILLTFVRLVSVPASFFPVGMTNGRVPMSNQVEPAVDPGDLAKPSEAAASQGSGAIELRSQSTVGRRHRRNLWIGASYGAVWLGLLLLIDSGQNLREGVFALLFAGALSLVVYGIAWLWDVAYSPEQPNWLMGTAKWSLVLACATLMVLELSVVVRDHADPDWRYRYAESYHYSC